MFDPVMKFVSCCRAAGQRISTSEVLDCMSQLQIVDIVDEPQFRAVLRSNFAKSRREQGKFDQLYRLFFHELRQGADIPQLSRLSEPIGRILDELEMQAREDSLGKSLLSFLSGNPLDFLLEINRIQADAEKESWGLKTNLAPLATRLSIMIRINATRSAIAAILADNSFKFGERVRQEIRRYFEERLESAQALIMGEPRGYDDGPEPIRVYEKRLEHLKEHPFSLLSQEELEEVREIIEQLARRLKDVHTRRYASHNRGMLDVKKTIRRAQRYQGIPVELLLKRKPPRKGKIVTLCDISSSVWSAARFMLNVLYSLQECFTRVNSFVFVAGLSEVTDIFDTHEINDAIERVLTEADLDYLASTDYGETFRQFKAGHMDVLNKKTTLIIIGDGRTNYFNPEDRILMEMREKCRRLIWLDPEPEALWYTGDSEIYAYKTFCHELRPCRNLNQLIAFVEELIL